MRQLIFLMALLIGQQLSAQTLSSAGLLGLYRWTESVILTPCDLEGKVIGDKVVAPIHQQFRVIQEMPNGDDVMIMVLDYDTTSQNFFTYNFKGTPSELESLGGPAESRELGGKRLYFLVDQDMVQVYSERFESYGLSLAFGSVSFPFKFRLASGASDFTGSFNFGAAIGIKLPHESYSKFQYSLLTGYSISNIVLDSVSVSRNASKLVSTNNFTAFSFSLGAMVEYEKVQAGVFIGWDRLNRINQDYYGWKYQGKPWFSVGFGYSIFSAKSANIQSGQSR